MNTQVLANYPKVRLVLYLISAALTIATFFVAIFAENLVQPFTATAAFLNLISGYTAITNIPKSDSGTTDEGSGTAS